MVRECSEKNSIGEACATGYLACLRNSREVEFDPGENRSYIAIKAIEWTSVFTLSC